VADRETPDTSDPGAAAAGGRSPDAAAAAGGRSPDAAAAAGGRSPDAARAPDDYEAKYMAGDGVIYRDKIKAPKTFFALLGLPLVIQAVAYTAVILQPKPVPPAIFLPVLFTFAVMSILALLFAVLRVTVTRKEVLVQYGLFGPKIPVSRIKDCKAVQYDWKQYGGWGIRRGRDGSWAYNMMGDAGRAVRMEWTDEKGKDQVTLVASPNPDALARAIQAARGVAAPKLRVAVDPQSAEFEAEAEAEAEAALHEEEKKKTQ